MAEGNVRLNQNRSVFGGLSARPGVHDPVVVKDLAIAADSAMIGRYRYRISFSLSGDISADDRHLTDGYPLLVKLQRGGQAASMAITSENHVSPISAGKFKRLQSLEGLFLVPEGAVVTLA